MDPREALAGLAEDFGGQADGEDLKARLAAASAQTLRQCASMVRLALKQVEQPSALVLDDAARERAYEVARDRLNEVDWSVPEERHRFVDWVLDAAAGAREADRG